MNSRELAGLAHLIPMKALEERDLPLETLETLRCLDPRPVEAGLEAAEARDLRDFRENVGALAILVQKR